MHGIVGEVHLISWMFLLFNAFAVSYRMTFGVVQGVCHGVTNVDAERFGYGMLSGVLKLLLESSAAGTKGSGHF